MISHAQQLQYLINYGYYKLLNIDAREARNIDARSIDFKEMVRHFQSFFADDLRISPDGVVGPITMAEMAKPRCGCQDVLTPEETAAAGARWSEACSRSLKVYAGLNGLRTNTTWPTVKSYEEAWYKEFYTTELICNFHADPVSSRGDAHYHCHAGSTSGGVLAWSEFPTSCSGNIESRFGTSWNWSRTKWMDTARHEIGHGLGLPHGPAGSVMYWTVDRAHDGKWEKWDIEQLVSRYGKPQPTVPPGPPQPDIIAEIIMTMRSDGTIEGTWKGKDVTPPSDIPNF